MGFPGKGYDPEFPASPAGASQTDATEDRLRRTHSGMSQDSSHPYQSAAESSAQRDRGSRGTQATSPAEAQHNSPNTGYVSAVATPPKKPVTRRLPKRHSSAARRHIVGRRR